MPMLSYTPAFGLASSAMANHVAAPSPTQPHAGGMGTVFQAARAVIFVIFRGVHQ